ncbi:GNAT family N-acetyltransferase [Streptomyces malaysiensis subsp. malaysiensis]|uniref:GNAT family N-acetyltransferase n=1 Tax=Streptomyces malaysiensis TaxID=92644 RepID=A0ABX6W829_STRMQ|nr:MULTISPECIES: GNAT family N-acetyltransferase [Streptomyces]QPI57598.1 GNAT family N-acetyltransferase [Streptomyces solisilvae]UHH19162.1 GNAT family N-acetyltransferase [Streptomyces sp. HNM0561]
MDHPIRPATAADIDAIEAVTDAAYRPYVARIGIRPAPMDADHTTDVAAGRVFVTGDPVMGVLVLVPESDHLVLESIAVHPDAHRQGMGKRLLAFADTHARALGLPEIRLYTNALMWENQEIYPRYGYEVTERRRDGQYDRVHYRKPIPEATPDGR